MALSPQIAGIIAGQIGRIQGKITSQVQSRVLEILSEFTNQCPPPDVIKTTSRQKNTLLKNINSLEKRVSSLKSTASKLDGGITAAKAIILVIKSIPIPTAIIPPVTGGIGIPINVLTKYSDSLIKINKLLDSLEADKAGILGVVNSASSTLSSLKNRLLIIDRAIEECSKESPELTSIVSEIQPKGDTGTEGTPQTAFGEDDPRFEYKGYKLEILQDPNSPQIAPRRYAIAKDKRGIIVLRGQPSFSASTDVLLDEVKFRIDNQLP